MTKDNAKFNPLFFTYGVQGGDEATANQYSELCTNGVKYCTFPDIRGMNGAEGVKEILRQICILKVVPSTFYDRNDVYFD